MSYAFRLFRQRADENPLATARDDADDLPITQPDPDKEALKQRVADMLIAHNTRLRIFQFDHNEIAKLEGISVDEARLRYRRLELNRLDEADNGVQIILFDDEASVTIPYWHDGANAADVFREIWSYLEIISREGDYLIYDPQLDRLIDTSEGYLDALASYRDTTHTVRQAFTTETPASKPWWKFW